MIKKLIKLLLKALNTFFKLHFHDKNLTLINLIVDKFYENVRILAFS